MPARKPYHWRLAKMTRCQRCAGKGSYYSGYQGERRKVECVACGGTGKVEPQR